MLSGFGSAVSAQELWLEPSKFFCKPGDSIKVAIKGGTDFLGQRWTRGNKTSVKSIAIYHLDYVSDLRSLMSETKDYDVSFSVQGEGTRMIGLQTDPSFRELDPDAFNSYLSDAALDDAYSQRQKTDALATPGRELYTNFARLLIQVGNKTDDTFKKETGAVIEVIPQQNPYSLKVGDRVQFKIMYQGKPLFGCRVKVWNRNNYRTSVQNIFTEQNGMIETHISNPGTWMVSVVKMIPSKDPQAEWQSFKASLVFGVK
jgi:uncharacterized GH25 family protein